MVEIEVKDIGYVKGIFLENYKWVLEEGNEEYIKKELVL